jgi:predicted HTH transcriptional regulator
MPEQEELERILRSGREGLSIEFKRSASFNDPATKGKVIRTALAMANIRDGGVLAFGIEEIAPNPVCELVGMTKADHDSFNQDNVTTTINTHATPHIDLSIEHLKIDDKLFVAVVIRQFADYPVICARDFVAVDKAAVIRGRIYCRSRRTPESTEVQTPEDLRDIINLATDRGLERYFRQREIERRLEQPAARDQFARQREDL